MPVTDELAGLRAIARKAEPEHHVVETALQHLQQHFTRHALGAGRLLEIVAELALEHAVHAARLLFLAQLRAVVGLLDPAALAVLAGGIGPALHGALVAAAARTLQEQLHSGTPAQPAFRVMINRHGALLDPAPLGRAATVVRNRGDVLDRGDLESGRLQRANRRFAPRARALHPHLDTLHAGVQRLARRRLGRHLRRERGALA